MSVCLETTDEDLSVELSSFGVVTTCLDVPSTVVDCTVFVSVALSVVPPDVNCGVSDSACATGTTGVVSVGVSSFMSESVFVVASTCSVDTSVSAFGAAVAGCEVSTESIAGLSLFATVGVSSFMSESVFVVASTCSVDTSVSAFGAAVAGCEVSTESIAGLSLFVTVGVVLSLSSDDVSSDTGSAS